MGEQVDRCVCFMWLSVSRRGYAFLWFPSVHAMVNKSAVPTAILALALLYFAALMVSAGPLASMTRSHVSKRSIVQLCEVLEATTDKSCLKFNNYGCFCGYGSVGSNPVDGVDRCCMIHDHCYHSLQCHWFSDPHLTVYSVNYTDRVATCLDSPTLWPCAYKACRCDVQFAACVATANYNDSYRRYNKVMCH
ncbi:unnamed protein product [Lymnaea stagnalis]|uniref:Phospholipase A2 n=1 Tax=Lymnaea stagnalis TaxID=6523 RepID=A0AAV2H6L6_LYMST